MGFETDPIPSSNRGNNAPDSYLLAYRECWDGRRLLIGEYVYTFGEPEPDNFLGGLNGESQVDRRQVMGTTICSLASTSRDIPPPPVGEPETETEKI